MAGAALRTRDELILLEDRAAAFGIFLSLEAHQGAGGPPCFVEWCFPGIPGGHRGTEDDDLEWLPVS